MHNHRKLFSLWVLLGVLGLLLGWEPTVALAGCTGKERIAPGTYERSVRMGWRARTYLLHVPPGYDPARTTPLVLALHGGYGEGKHQQQSGMDAVADREGFITVYPDGFGRSWNGGECCGPAMKHGIDDVGFVRALIDRLSQELCLDPRRIYATGMSNGALMSYRLACELSDRIAAIAPVAAVIRFSPCDPKRPVPVLHIHGTADQNAPYEGGHGRHTFGPKRGEVNRDTGRWPSVEATMREWTARNQCREQPMETYQNGAATCVRYGGCAQGADVELCTIRGGNHSWPGAPGTSAYNRLMPPSRDLDANEVIWRFFAEHPMPRRPPSLVPRQHSVGYQVMQIPLGTKRLPLAVWFPTETPTRHFQYPQGQHGTVAPDAPVKPGKWPLLVFSHGFGGGGTAQTVITEELAREGWLVVAPDHSDPVSTVRTLGGPTATSVEIGAYLRKHPFDRNHYAYRPVEVSSVLDYFLSSPLFPIDKEKVVLVGHSMGGYSVMSVALGDPRIKAVALYSMGELNWLSGKRFFEAHELRSLPIPSLYLYGEKEKRLNPRGVYAEFCFAHSPSPTYLVEVPSGNHFTYTDREIAPRLGGTRGELSFIVSTTSAFLRRHILGEPSSFQATKTKGAP